MLFSFLLPGSRRPDRHRERNVERHRPLELCVEPLEPRVLLSGTAIGETGMITISQSGPTQWHTVDLTGSYENAVVIAQPASYNGPEPTTVRIRNVASDSFEIQLDEWDYLDGVHQAEKIGYVVMEVGTHVLTGGATVHVGTAQVNHFYKTVDLPSALPITPTVLTQSQTVNGGSAIVTRQRNATSGKFEVKLQEEQAADGRHSFETVGYIAMAPGTATTDGILLQAGLTTPVFESSFSTINFAADFSEAPIFIAGLQTSEGGDPAGLRYRNLQAETVEVLVEEEKSEDNETSHAGESVGFLAFDQAGQIYAQPTMVVGETGSLSIMQANGNQWHLVNLTNTYVDPVVIAQPASYSGRDPTTVRVRNVTSTSFEVQLDEWDYLDGSHSREDVGYAVFESGNYVLDGGLPVEVGKTVVNHNFKTVTFGSEFSSTPAILTQSQTVVGGAAIVTRQKNPSSSSFDVKLQEEEGADGTHSFETVGYVAVGTGQGFSDGVGFESGVMVDTVDSRFRDIQFTVNFDAPPIFLASMQTTNGDDPATLRFKESSLKPDSPIQVFVEEEQSADQEKVHGTEDVGFLAFADPGNLIAREIKPFGEAGKVTIAQNSGNQWHTVTLNNTYSHPVVIAQPPSFNGGEPATVRLRNVMSNSFEIQIDEWDYLDGGHTAETISYVVIEKGTHFIEDSRALHVGTRQINHNFKTVHLPSVFTSTPVVVSQSQTVVGGSAIITRTNNSRFDRVDIRLQEEQGNDGTHSFESVGFFAMNLGVVDTGSTQIVAGFGLVGTDFTPINFTQPFDNTPAFIGGVQSFFGGDVVATRYQNLTNTGVEVFLEEETSGDTETGHNPEDFSYLAFDEGDLFAFSTRSSGSALPQAPPENMTGNDTDNNGVQELAFSMSRAISRAMFTRYAQGEAPAAQDPNHRTTAYDLRPAESDSPSYERRTFPMAHAESNWTATELVDVSWLVFDDLRGEDVDG